MMLHVFVAEVGLAQRRLITIVNCIHRYCQAFIKVIKIRLVVIIVFKTPCRIK